MSKRYSKQRRTRGEPVIPAEPVTHNEPRYTLAKYGLCALLAAAAGVGVTYLSMRSQRSSNPSPTQISANATSTTATLVSSTAQHPLVPPQDPLVVALKARFNQLDSEKQKEALETILTRVDAESGIGAVYDYVLAHVPVQTKTLAELETDAKTDSVSQRILARYKDNSVIGYNPVIACIILPPTDAKIEFQLLFKSGLTRKGMRAYMALHHLQEQNYPHRSLLDYLERKDIVDVQGRVLTTQLTQNHVQHIARKYLKNPTATYPDVRGYILGVQRRSAESRALFNAGSMALAPRVQAAPNGGVEYEFPLSALNSNITQPPPDIIAGPLVAAAYGYALSQGYSIPDIRANTFLAEEQGYEGSPLQNVHAALARTGMLKSCQKRGESLLLGRAERLREKILKIVNEELQPAKR